MDRNQIEKIVKEMDPKLDNTSDTFKRATILLASAFAGPSRKEVSEMLGINENDKILVQVEENAIKNGIWKNGKVNCEWMDEESGGVAFWLDVCVVEGLMKRTKGGFYSFRR